MTSILTLSFEVVDGLLVVADVKHGDPELFVGEVAGAEVGGQLHRPGVGAGVDQAAEDGQLLVIMIIVTL